MLENIRMHDRFYQAYFNFTEVQKKKKNVYHIYPKYWDTLSNYHTCPKILNSPFY